MARKIILMILILCAAVFSFLWEADAATPDKVRLFEKYNFESGRYAVVGMIWSDQGNKIQKALGDFYTDDVDILSELKQKWITDEPSPMFACGYHYTISVLKDGREVESFSLNLEEGCNTIVTDRGHYYFDPDKLGAFIGRFKKPIIERKVFKTRAEGSAYLKSLSGRTDVLMTRTSEGFDYDGEFRFYADCNFGGFDNNRMQQCLTRVEKQIMKKYPGEKFMVDEAGSMWGAGKSKILIRMKCRKGLYNKFDLYAVEWKWSGYSSELMILWKSR